MSAPAVAVIAGLRDSCRVLPARHRRYLLTCLAANLLIWSLALAWLLLVPPAYTAQWSLIIPASEADARISLTDVGQAYSAPRSSYDARSLDPRVNYREIALSRPVIAHAARLAGVATDEFPQPRVKLIDQSTVIEFEVSAAAAASAYRMADALNEALRARLDELRADEASRRELGVDAALQSARGKLEAAQRAVIDFKIASQIVSVDELSRIGTSRVELEGRRRALEEQVARLSAAAGATGRLLGVTPSRAAHAIVVQSDSLFMEHYRHYVEASTLLTEYRFKFGDRHPRVLTEGKRQSGMFEALVRRAQELHGAALDAGEIRQLIVLLGNERNEPIFAEFVATSVALRAASAELDVVDRQLRAMGTDQDRLARNFATLGELERRLQFAEAVFNSTLGKTDIGRADIYASYPLVQDLVPPGLPEEPSAPMTSLVLLGALASTLFATVGLTLAWMRQRNVGAAAIA